MIYSPHQFPRTKLLDAHQIIGYVVNQARSQCGKLHVRHLKNFNTHKQLEQGMEISHLKTVRNDMRTLMKDAQDLFREASMATGEKAEELRGKGAVLLEAAGAKAQELQTAAVQTGKEVAETTDQYVHENPWKAVAISAGVGLVLGMLIARR